MDVVSACALPVAARVWPTMRGGWTLTVVCKATYLLLPVTARLVETQEAPNEEDTHWDDDPGRSLSVASDLIPFKPRADVVLVGSAYAPGKLPARSITARLVVGNEIDKAVEAWCDRAWTQDGQLREGPRVTKVPLRYERAAGGPESWNPVGVRHDAPPDRYGMRPLPDLQPPGVHVEHPGDAVEPIGFGPIAPTWPWRWKKLGRYAGTWNYARWWEQPLPEGFDPSYFNMAPRDQQVAELRDNERLVLENLHPDHPRLVTSLPGLRPHAVVERGGRSREEVALVCDTLWIDTDRGVASLVWRGRLSMSRADEPGRVVVTTEGGAAAGAGSAAEQPGSTMTAELLAEEVDEEADVVRTMAAPIEANPAGAVLPFAGGHPSGRAGAPPAPSAGEPARAGLPFARLGEASPLQPPAPAPPAPAGAAAIPPSAAPGMASAAAGGPPPIAPPPLVTRPPVIGPIAPAAGGSPWSTAGAGPAPTIGQQSAEAAAPAPPGLVKEPPAQGSAAAASDAAARAAQGGAALASNEAAQAARAAQAGAKAGVSFRPAVELIWLNLGSLPRIRKQPQWKELLAGVKPRPEDEDLDDDLPPPRRIPPKDRREVLALLARGEALNVEGLEAALQRALEDPDGFVPPLVLAEGELELQFDELEVLKATLAAVTPHVPGNARLKETVDRIQEAFKAPWMQSANSVLEELTAQVRDMFAQTAKGVAPGYLDGHVERTLLDGRHYQKRMAFGQMRLRALLGEAGATRRAAVYLPEALEKELPRFRRLWVRMIGEVRPRGEMADPGVALRTLGIGRESRI